ncbi:hypothetical protein [Photobacterium kasasachensis]|uniref:hypothetical protein n=1 Tax=Photobacterium kasasachensis TaxID=2910240 RepID=UPI003D10BE7F
MKNFVVLLFLIVLSGCAKEPEVIYNDYDGGSPTLNISGFYKRGDRMDYFLKEGEGEFVFLTTIESFFLGTNVDIKTPIKAGNKVIVAASSSKKINGVLRLDGRCFEFIPNEKKEYNLNRFDLTEVSTGDVPSSFKILDFRDCRIPLK